MNNSRSILGRTNFFKNVTIFTIVATNISVTIFVIIDHKFSKSPQKNHFEK